MDEKVKKDFILMLGRLSDKLDLIRTNLNIIIYNLISNNLIKQLPKFDSNRLDDLIHEVDNMTLGLSKDYFDINNKAKEEMKGNK